MEVLQMLVVTVDAELVKGIGTAGHVLWSRKVEEANECFKVVTAEMLVDILIEPSEE
jgi:hypothetical protein